jgi:hypothetical protein
MGNGQWAMGEDGQWVALSLQRTIPPQTPLPSNLASIPSVSALIGHLERRPHAKHRNNMSSSAIDMYIQCFTGGRPTQSYKSLPMQ